MFNLFIGCSHCTCNEFRYPFSFMYLIKDNRLCVGIFFTRYNYWWKTIKQCIPQNSITYTKYIVSLEPMSYSYDIASLIFHWNSLIGSSFPEKSQIFVQFLIKFSLILFPSRTRLEVRLHLRVEKLSIDFDLLW